MTGGTKGITRSRTKGLIKPMGDVQDTRTITTTTTKMVCLSVFYVEDFISRGISHNQLLFVPIAERQDTRLRIIGMHLRGMAIMEVELRTITRTTTEGEESVCDEQL